MRIPILCLFLFLMLLPVLHAQDVIVRPRVDQISGDAVSPRPSPTAITFVKKGDKYVKITYCQPHLRGRQMLGDNIAYGKIWRLGANEATELYTANDVTIAGKMLKAGAYSVFAITYPDKWTLVFNSELGQWGAYTYDESKDVLRVDVPVTRAAMNFEAFTMWFSATGDKLNMAWGETLVEIPIVL